MEKPFFVSHTAGLVFYTPQVTPKFRSIIQIEYNKRRIVQLTLF